ncbi:MAG: LON peptidase substrate-binding domain-containing protein [Verrucomicrobiales bacterium]
MVLPPELPVMTLPGAILFPQVMLPLRIFEERYRIMLKDVLASHRTFAVAMQKSGSKSETPSPVAGLGLIRACVDHKDGTSHLVLQGIGRIHLKTRVKLRPYRLYEYDLIETKQSNRRAVNALTAQVLGLVIQRFKEGHTIPVQLLDQLLKSDPMAAHQPVTESSLDNIINFFSKLESAEHFADLVSCTLLAAPKQRQTILETADVETRLKHLIHFLQDQDDDGLLGLDDDDLFNDDDN